MKTVSDVSDFFASLNLQGEAKKEEARLRGEMLREWQNYRESPLKLGKILCELKEKYVPPKKFERYLKLHEIPHSSAYEFMKQWKAVEGLGIPEAVVEEAVAQRINLGTKKNAAIFAEISVPTNPTKRIARECVEKFKEEARKQKVSSREALHPEALPPEQRRRVTAAFFTRKEKEFKSFLGHYWADVSADQDDVQLATSFFARVARLMGIGEAFKVAPTPSVQSKKRPTERVQKYIVEDPEPVAA